MSAFTLAISYLTTSNLPWFMGLTFQVPMQYYSLQHRTLLLLPVTSTAGYCFCFGSIPSFSLELFPHWSPVAYWAPADLGSSSFVSYHFAFSCCSWGSQGKNTEVVCHCLLQWTTFCQTSPPWPVRLGWPHTTWLSFTELDKAVVLWSDWPVSCDYGFSVSALWCPLTTPTVLLGFLLPRTWGISYSCSSKAQLRFLPWVMASDLITSWEIDGETVETVSDFIFLGSKITADGDCSHEIKRHLLLGRKVITNLDSMLKSRDITLPSKVHLVKAMFF